MPKLISAVDATPTLLAMVMLDRRRALLADSLRRSQELSPHTDTRGPTEPQPAISRPRRDRRAKIGSEATA